MARLYSRSGSYLSKAARLRHEEAEQRYIAMGIPEKLANRMSLLLLTRPALDMADLAAERKRDVLDAAALYATLNQTLGLHWLHNRAEDLAVDGLQNFEAVTVLLNQPEACVPQCAADFEQHCNLGTGRNFVVQRFNFLK